MKKDKLMAEKYSFLISIQWENLSNQLLSCDESERKYESHVHCILKGLSLGIVFPILFTLKLTITSIIANESQ